MINDGYSKLSLSVFVLGMSYLFWKYVQRKRNVVGTLPMPDSASWIWGHELEIFRHEASEIYIKWAASLAVVHKIKAALFQPDIVIVGDNFAAHHILQNTDTYARAPLFLLIVARLAGKGIVWAEGEDHRYQRRLLAPAFTSGAIEAMADTIFSCVDKMSQKLRSSLIGTGGKTNGAIIDIVPVMSACTLDIIGRVGFGHEFESTETRAISSAWHQDVVLAQTFAGFMAPIMMTIFPFITRLPIPAFQDNVVRKFVHQLAGKILSDNSKDADVLGGNDMLSILRNANQNMDEKSDQARLSTTELLDNITIILIAGHETSAVTADFILLRLAQNPAVQRKLQQEVRTLPSLDYNSVVTLEYLNAVVKEGLRLHPAAPPTERVALQDDVIPLNQAIRAGSGEMISSFDIKAGQVLRIPLAVLNTSKQVWGNNASEFIPERWIEPGGLPSIDKLPRGPWGDVSSFSDGPRSCIGYRLAILELKIIIAVLVRSFEFECTEAKTTQRLSPNLQPITDGKPAVMPLKVSLVSEL
ncbi:cytochrome P450 [Rhodocollybia butyracea]|uniref:Cytochrome P450 n=1 Tax=Rhodocollybia butyracea TaxID=206335 RepID=A0A9P5PMZ3_9AGAR|nr:cytochrome P450 [Rhodocollybia butyracea]